MCRPEMCSRLAWRSHQHFEEAYNAAFGSFLPPGLSLVGMPCVPLLVPPYLDAHYGDHGRQKLARDTRKNQQHRISHQLPGRLSKHPSHNSGMSFGHIASFKCVMYVLKSRPTLSGF